MGDHEEQQLMVMKPEIEELKQKKPAQGQPPSLMNQIAERMRGKIQVA
jgi:hypothetical protein